MIPQNILHPKGCNHQGEGILVWFCSKKHLCRNCQNIQKAQAQVLLDEKKSKLVFLEDYKHKVEYKRLEVAGLSILFYPILEKIQELQKEIKLLTEKLNTIGEKNGNRI